MRIAGPPFLLCFLSRFVLFCKSAGCKLCEGACAFLAMFVAACMAVLEDVNADEDALLAVRGMGLAVVDVAVYQDAGRFVDHVDELVPLALLCFEVTLVFTKKLGL